MANKDTNLNLISSSQAQKEVTANALFDSMSPGAMFGRCAQTTSGLTWGYYGGIFTKGDGSHVSISNGTISLAASVTNYIEADSVGAINHNTSSFTAGRIPLYTVTTGSDAVTDYIDQRDGTQGNYLSRYAAATLSDGDKGDITISGGGTVFTIDNDVISYAKMQNVSATDKLLGRSSAGAGDVQEIACTAAGRALIDDADAAAQRTTLGLGTVATLAADTDGTLAANSDTVIASQKAVKTYVDTKLDGRSWKQTVRAATTTNGALSTAFANGQVIDGVTLATGDRILLKNQTTSSENGIYVVAAAGSPARSSDADTGAELVNATVAVSEGTANQDTQWQCSTNAPITVGSTSLVWINISTASTYTADESTLHLAGGQFSLLSTAPVTHAATAKTTPVDNDEFGVVDSAASNVLKKVTWANIKATLKTYFDTLYGYLGIPQNSQSAAYTTVLSDAGKHIFHPSADTTARTFTIDSNANVAYPIGTAITFINQNGGGTITIAITSDTMRLAGAGTTGSRTLAANGVATAIKVASTEWIISGTNLT